MKPIDILPGGAGSGGGPEDQEHFRNLDGRHTVCANQVEFIARPGIPPASPDTAVVSLLADQLGTGGQIEIRGSQGVRVTTGPFMLPPASSDSTNGIELVASELQNVTIQRGLIDGVDQKIEMAPASITVDGGIGTIMIQSLTEITFSVAGGLSTIKLTPAGIQIQGILVMIN